MTGMPRKDRVLLLLITGLPGRIARNRIGRPPHEAECPRSNCVYAVQRGKSHPLSKLGDFPDANAFKAV